MINYQFFPRSHGLTSEMKAIVDCFVAVDAEKAMWKTIKCFATRLESNS